MQKEKLALILAILSVSLFLLLMVGAGIVFFRIYLKRKNTLLFEKERMSLQFKQSLLDSKLEMQEETFNYIGKEIHDNIGQVLSLVRINLNTLTANPDEQKVLAMDELMGRAITDLRNLSHSLDTDLIRSTGWTKAAEKLLLALQKTGTCKVEFYAEEPLPAIADEKHIILFRMIQEIIHNIIKHAKAKEIKFKALKKGNQIWISIEDNGQGFDKMKAASGAGLQNLKSRASMMNANLNIDTAPGSGTCVTISVNI